MTAAGLEALPVMVALAGGVSADALAKAAGHRDGRAAAALDRAANGRSRSINGRSGRAFRCDAGCLRRRR